MSRVPVQLTRAPFDLSEAQRAGLTHRHLQSATWRRVAPAIYAWAGLPDGPMLTLAGMQKRLPEGAVFSGRTAAWLHGLDLPPCDPLEVTIRPEEAVSARAGARVFRAELVEHEVVFRHGFPATSIPRTLADLAWHAPLVEAVIAADMALHLGLTTHTELLALVDTRAARKGVRRLRRVVALSEPAAESPMETRLRLLLVYAGLPRPVAQVRLHDADGRFVARPDLYYPTNRLALEYDGASHRDSLVEDSRRQNRLVTAGYRLLRFTAADVLGTPDAVVERVRLALAQR